MSVQRYVKESLQPVALVGSAIMAPVATRVLLVIMVEFATVGIRILHVLVLATLALQDRLVNLPAALHARVMGILTTPDVVRATSSGHCLVV